MIRLMRRQLGVTLIELLITMVIVSIGVLGLAGVQILSLSRRVKRGKKWSPCRRPTIYWTEFE